MIESSRPTATMGHYSGRVAYGRTTKTKITPSLVHRRSAPVTAYHLDSDQNPYVAVCITNVITFENKEMLAESDNDYNQFITILYSRMGLSCVSIH